MVHAVHIYNTGDASRPREIVKSVTSPDWATVRDHAWIHLAATGGDLDGLNIVPDADLFETLADYIAALNLPADWLEAHPRAETPPRRIGTDTRFWAKIGVTTPRDLEARLAESGADAQVAHPLAA